MNHSHENQVADAQGTDYRHRRPRRPRGHAAARAGVPRRRHPLHLRPGPGPALFNGEELLNFLQLADYCCVNDYEAQLLSEKTGRPIEELAGMVEALIVTLGANGARNPCRGNASTSPASSRMT
jgi:adenosine kinase